MPAAPAAASHASEEPSVGSRVHVREDEGGEEVIGLVTAVAHGWFTVELPGQTQPRKCRRGEIRLLPSSSSRRPAAAAAAAEEEDEDEEVIIRLDGFGGQNLKKKPQPVSQIQRDAARLASVRLETGLPKPSYLRFDKLGSHAKKASLDPKATRALAAPPARALLPAIKSGKGEKEGGGKDRQTQAAHRDKEAEQDAKMILMRNFIDPKRFYKGLDSLAPGFQIGTVIEGRMETGPQGRLSRKQRKRTFVDEILADRAVRKYSKRKYSEIQQAAQSGRKGWQKKQQRKHQPK